jgi:hypothetical protein
MEHFQFQEILKGKKIETILTADLRAGADKSLARLQRKQAAATKLGIYSTYSP